jgi:signal transduction histidine kinase
MKYSIWRIIFFLLAFIGIVGLFFVLSISFFFYKYNIDQATTKKIIELEFISNTVAGPSWTVKESYPGTIENVFRGVLKMPGTKFIRIVDEENKTIEKSDDSAEENMAVNNLPEFNREVTMREGILNGEQIKEFSIKARDGSNLWLGVSFAEVKKNILYSAALIGLITLLLFSATVIIAYLLVRNIVVSPLKNLSNAFEKLKNKDYNVQLGDTRISELRNVFQSFNAMSAKVKEAEEKITEELNRTKQLDKIKSEFISVAAHQLRTPLSAVKWTLKMIIDGDLGSLNAEQKTFLMQGYQTNERTIRLVNDFLNVVRIEEGRFGYELTSIHIEDLIDNIIQEFTHRVKEKGIAFFYDKPKDRLPIVKIDPSKMRLALQNLIDNAIKYTPAGGKVTISIKYSKLYISIAVEDSGIGIPKHQIKRLFGKFFRSDNAIKSQTEGSGLGLFIVKNIIEKHGGKVSVKSDENKGSTFTVTLPIDKTNS